MESRNYDEFDVEILTVQWMEMNGIVLAIIARLAQLTLLPGWAGTINNNFWVKYCFLIGGEGYPVRASPRSE